jgi:hypothetical protein
MTTLVGTWHLVTQVARRQDGVQTFPRGEHPLGLLVYDANGWMSVHLMRRDAHGDLEALQTALGEYLGYFGRYVVDEARGVVTHHIEGCSFPGWIGTSQERAFQFDGDRLTLTNVVVDGKTTSTRVLTWERVE